MALAFLIDVFVQRAQICACSTLYPLAALQYPSLPSLPSGRVQTDTCLCARSIRKALFQKASILPPRIVGMLRFCISFLWHLCSVRLLFWGRVRCRLEAVQVSRSLSLFISSPFSGVGFICSSGRSIPGSSIRCLCSSQGPLRRGVRKSR